jgi:hypothetical protein
LNINLGLQPYKKVIEPSLFDDQKIKRKKIATWVRTNFGKGETMKIFFLDEKFSDIHGAYQR